MKTHFGELSDGRAVSLYTITGGGITATATDYGATLVSVFVPDAAGNIADVCLGFDCPGGYTDSTCFLGAVVGRSANRIQGARFALNGKEYTLQANENTNNLHSGPHFYHLRMWTVEACNESSITFRLDSPDGDQGFPGNAVIRVTYSLDSQGGLHVIYDGISDKDTVFNLTQHAYFNLAGQENTDKAMDQILTIPGRFFNPADDESIPTGELRDVTGTPMDFRTPKPIGRDINEDYDALILQGGYDHNWEVFCNPCAILEDPVSGRTMSVYTDCPGIQFYAGNFLSDETGKGGVVYGKRSGICLETQYYPNSINQPAWPQPITKAGEKYHSETVYKFN